MRRLLFLLACVSLFSASAAELGLLPTPREVSLSGGRGLQSDALQSVTAAEGVQVPILGPMLDALPRNGRQPCVHFAIDTVGTPTSGEGYTLRVDSRGATIAARSQAGLFYGAATLEQLLQHAADCRQPVPALQITDYPALDYRAVHFDSKHHVERLDYYYTLIDRLAHWKVNAIIWELADKLQYPSHPECSAPNAISTQQMQALSRYARERNIEISPLVQGLGHADFILKRHWELRENPSSDWEFCPSNPATYELQFDLYRDALEALPDGKYLHVGGDEITEIGIDERCRATGLTPFQLQMQWLGKVVDWAHAHGRQPIVWDDMPLKYGNLWWVLHGGLSDEEVEREFHTEGLDEAIEMFPKGCVYMRWHYDDPTTLAHRKILDWYATKGLTVMGATAASDGGSPYMPRHGSKTREVRDFCRLSAEHGFNGILATAWEDGSPHNETVQRGFAALGQWSWNPQATSLQDFKEAFAEDFFGLYNGETSFIEELEEAANFFDGALVSSGRRNPAWQVREYTLLDIPQADSIRGRWSAKHRERLDSARLQIERCQALEGQIAYAMAQAHRGRYLLEIYEQNRRLFQFPARLLLALEDYDLNGKPLPDLQAEFDTLRHDLEEVYSRTRQMQQPAGYIADMNHHSHLAALSPDASWLYLYEIPMLRKIVKRE